MSPLSHLNPIAKTDFFTGSEPTGTIAFPELDRSIHWISSVDGENRSAVALLQDQMVHFYTHNPNYYPALIRSEQWWKGDPFYDLIVSELRATEGTIVEAGCGRANLLRNFPEFASRYVGFDFSPDVIAENAASLSGAKFYTIKNPRVFPVETSSAAVLFSTWVLEHCAYPCDFLDECARVVKKGGTLIILTPDFLNGAPIPSQRCGSSEGAARNKWRRGLKRDAIVTAFDKKVKIPLYCLWLRLIRTPQAGFYINLRPACFRDPFEPDIDAVYLTWKKEIKDYLADRIEWAYEPPKVPGRHVICLVGRRK